MALLFSKDKQNGSLLERTCDFSKAESPCHDGSLSQCLLSGKYYILFRLSVQEKEKVTNMITTYCLSHPEMMP